MMKLFNITIALIGLFGCLGLIAIYTFTDEQPDKGITIFLLVLFGLMALKDILTETYLPEQKRTEIKEIWCLLFHSKDWRRTEERTIHKTSISYKVICNRCGLEQREVNWVL